MLLKLVQVQHQMCIVLSIDWVVLVCSFPLFDDFIYFCLDKMSNQKKVKWIS